MRNKIILMTAMGILQLGTASALSTEGDYLPNLEPVQSEQAPEVIFVSGGIGENGKAEIEAIQQDYNLKLLFASTAGYYLGDVAVTIKDAKGRIVLDTLTDGPFLLVKLRPGRYTVEAQYDDAVERKKIIVEARRMKSYDFHLNTYE